MHFFHQDAREHTSLGIASLEAMAAGKAILAWANENAYGQGRLRDGSNIVLGNPNETTRLADTVIDLLLDYQKRREIGERASQTIKKHFSWESVCSKTLDVYREALN